MFKLFCVVLILPLYYVLTKELINVPGSDFCVPDGKTKLEVAFVIDQSSTYIQTKYPVLRNLVEYIYKEWPGSKVGVTTFSDYSCLIWRVIEECIIESLEEPYPNGTRPTEHRHPEGCYMFAEALSSDPKPILDRIHTQNIEYLPSGDLESGIAAIYRTIVEPKMKWTPAVDLDENLLRIILLVSDAPSWDGPIRSRLPLKDLKGDGTDKCLENKNPRLDFVGETLDKLGMTVYMLYSDTQWNIGDETFDDWSSYLRVFQKFFNLFTRINELNSTNYKNEFKTFVTDLKHSKVMPCADPPPYNTLGL